MSFHSVGCMPLDGDKLLSGWLSICLDNTNKCKSSDVARRVFDRLLNMLLYLALKISSAACLTNECLFNLKDQRLTRIWPKSLSLLSAAEVTQSPCHCIKEEWGPTMLNAHQPNAMKAHWLASELLGYDSLLTGHCGVSQIMLSCQACNEETQTNGKSSGKLTSSWWTSFRGDNMQLIKCRL